MTYPKLLINIWICVSFFNSKNKKFFQVGNDFGFETFHQRHAILLYCFSVLNLSVTCPLDHVGIGWIMLDESDSEWQCCFAGWGMIASIDCFKLPYELLISFDLQRQHSRLDLFLLEKCRNTRQQKFSPMIPHPYR